MISRVPLTVASNRRYPSGSSSTFLTFRRQAGHDLLLGLQEVGAQRRVALAHPLDDLHQCGSLLQGERQRLQEDLFGEPVVLRLRVVEHLKFPLRQCVNITVDRALAYSAFVGKKPQCRPLPAVDQRHHLHDTDEFINAFELVLELDLPGRVKHLHLVVEDGEGRDVTGREMVDGILDGLLRILDLVPAHRSPSRCTCG